MYVATRELKVYKKVTGEKVIYRAGDVVKDFESWDIHAQRANLNMEYVIKKEGSAKKTEPVKQVAKPAKTQQKSSKKEKTAAKPKE